MSARHKASSPPPTRNSVAGMGCLMLFAAPFAIGGLLGFGAAIRAALHGNWNEFGGLALFGLLFGGVGFGIGAAAFYGRRNAAHVERNRGAYPDQPWLWEKKWSTGRIRGEGLHQARGQIVFAIFWNGICLPGLFAGFDQIRQEDVWIQCLVAQFPVVGLGLALVATRSYLRYRHFGHTWFEMAPLPAPVGHRLTGTIDAGFITQPSDGPNVQLRLCCVRIQRSQSSRSSGNNESILWEEHTSLASNSLAPLGERTRIPVSFEIPADAEPTQIHEHGSTIRWRLHVDANRTGLDLKTYFEVPVYRTAASSSPASPTSSEADTQPQANYTPSGSRIRVEQFGGTTQIHFPAARNVGFLLSLATFSAIWTTICVFLARSDAPLIFPIVFIGFDALLLVSLFFMLTLSRTLVMSGGELEVTESVLGFRRTHWLVAEEVAGFEIKQGMRSGETLYYDLWLQRKTQRPLKLGGGIRDKRETRWLLQQVKSALGLAES